MDALSQIKALISDFAGYAGDEQRRLADEQIRAYVGERLAALPGAHLDALGPDQRARYDRVLLLCEFMNQAALDALKKTPRRLAWTVRWPPMSACSAQPPNWRAKRRADSTTS